MQDTSTTNVSALAPRNVHKFAVGQRVWYVPEQCEVEVVERSFRLADMGKDVAPPGYRVRKHGMISIVMESDLEPMVHIPFGALP